ncbi:MAG: hypothetical protein P1U38_13390 [Aeromicrobium sp.]|uniref:hypothetical protein n=1 Tax=Aeromicrobium sp. TaxID=1871063 RepID=UPI002635FA17|nr:hypothetical protein [Aeromicrobium sp.]MDF1705759.1 hypothetical protein [Aeromicrobium sp.]
MRSRAWAGTAGLTRLALSTERRWILGALVAYAATYVATASQIRQIAGTVGERVGLQGTVAQTPAFRVLLGPFEHPGSIGGTTLWRVGLFMLAVVAVLAATVLVRVTRRAEEQGQAELVGAAAVGRLAALGAGAVAASLVVLAAALGTAVGLAAGAGAGAVDAVAAGTQVLCVGAAGAGGAAVAAQVAQASRAALGLSIGIVLAAYAVRGAADVRHSDVVDHLTPFGWAEAIDPFGAVSWWPLLTAAVAALGLMVVAILLRGRRDLGSGLLAPRPGPASAGSLRTPVAVTLRLEARPAVVWTLALVGFGVFVGSLVPTIDRLGAAEGGLADALRRLGGAGALTDVFVGAMASIGGLAVAGWGLALVTRVHADETGGRLEQVLATSASRTRALLAPAAVAGGGVLPALAVVGLATGVAGADLGDAVAASVVQAPAVWVVVALGVLGQAVGGRWTVLAWGGLVVATVVGQVGAAVGMPEWLQQVSPFTHVPGVPSERFEIVPELALSGVAALLLGLAVLAFRRRDVPR